MSINNKLIVISGPTASGKSEMALKLAIRLRSKQAQKKFGIKGAEIITADSRQIYKEMLIATGSPLSENQKSKIKIKKGKIKYKNQFIKETIINAIPHYLLHFIDPNQKFSVAEYKSLAIQIIRDIQKRKKIPILVGGTGLYISSIIDNIEIPKIKPNIKLRQKLEKTPLTALLKRLNKLDAATFKTIDKNNKRRIIRALEVTLSSGKPFSEQREKGAPLFDILEIGIDMPREKLYKKIDERVEKMFKLGLIKETKKLAKKYSIKLPSMSGIGYKEIIMFLNNKITCEEAEKLVKFATHAYARRQTTWFKRDKNIHWIKKFKQANKISEKFLISQKKYLSETNLK